MEDYEGGEEGGLADFGDNEYVNRQPERPPSQDSHSYDSISGCRKTT